MGSKHLYGVFLGDEMVFKGCSREISRYLCIEQTSVMSYAKRKTLTNGKYRIEVLGPYVEEEKPKPKSQKEKDHEDHLANIIAMLKLHGATFVRDPSIWEKEVNEAGIKFTKKKWENGYRLERR